MGVSRETPTNQDNEMERKEMLIKMSNDEYMTIDDDKYAMVGYKLLVSYESNINGMTIDTAYDVIYDNELIARVRTVRPIIGDTCDSRATITVSDKLTEANMWCAFTALRHFLDSLENDYYPTLLDDLETLQQTNEWHMYNSRGNIVATESQSELNYIMRHYLSGLYIHDFNN